MTTHTPSSVLPTRRASTDLTRYLVPLGRLCLSLIFLHTLFAHFSRPTIEYAAQQGVPSAGVLVPLSGVIAVIGGLSVTLGYYARWGAGLLILFLIPVTLMMHRFWAIADPMAQQMQLVMFMKNVSILGGLLFLVYFGAGPVSVDTQREGSLGAKRS
jgi:putative oxidoreductase